MNGDIRFLLVAALTRPQRDSARQGRSEAGKGRLLCSRLRVIRHALRPPNCDYARGATSARGQSMQKWGRGQR